MTRRVKTLVLLEHLYKIDDAPGRIFYREVIAFEAVRIARSLAIKELKKLLKTLQKPLGDLWHPATSFHSNLVSNSILNTG
jgi:hypothetical protein